MFFFVAPDGKNVPPRDTNRQMWDGGTSNPDQFMGDFCQNAARVTYRQRDWRHALFVSYLCPSQMMGILLCVNQIFYFLYTQKPYGYITFLAGVFYLFEKCDPLWQDIL